MDTHLAEANWWRIGGLPLKSSTPVKAGFAPNMCGVPDFPLEFQPMGVHDFISLQVSTSGCPRFPSTIPALHDQYVGVHEFSTKIGRDRDMCRLAGRVDHRNRASAEWVRGSAPMTDRRCDVDS